VLSSKAEQRLQKEKGEAEDDGTYGIKRALPVVGDVGLAFRRFLEDPFVTFIRGHLSHQPACNKGGPNHIDLLAHPNYHIVQHTRNSTIWRAQDTYQ
jgi:hypothetical protein